MRYRFWFLSCEKRASTTTVPYRGLFSPVTATSWQYQLSLPFHSVDFGICCLHITNSDFLLFSTFYSDGYINYEVGAEEWIQMLHKGEWPRILITILLFLVRLNHILHSRNLLKWWWKNDKYGRNSISNTVKCSLDTEGLLSSIATFNCISRLRKSKSQGNKNVFHKIDAC